MGGGYTTSAENAVYPKEEFGNIEPVRLAAGLGYLELGFLLHLSVTETNIVILS